MLWKIRCVLFWVFFALGVMGTLSALAALWHFRNEPALASVLMFPPVLGFAIGTLWIIGYMLGRLFSWTDPVDDFPRFRDRR